jgi:hypothetical protein
MVDIEAQRAYLNTETAAAGDEIATPSVGLTVYPHLDFGISGTNAAIDLQRRALIDGQTICDFTTSTMNGDYITWCTERWVATAGQHTLRWDLDFNHAVAESNESNNTVSTSWTSAAPGDVDLVAERAYLNTMARGAGNLVTVPVVGQAVYFHLDFSLVGAGGAVAISRRAVIDGHPFCDFSAASAPGAYVTWCSDAWTATAGEHTLRWDVDYKDTVTETNENNNSVSTMFISAPAGSVDLEAQRAYLRTMSSGDGDEVATPSVGQTVYFYLDFRVVSSGDAILADRQATLDGQPYCGFTGTAAPGDYYAWCNDGWIAVAGSHTLRWDLDFNHALAETNENNNSASTGWTTGAAACGGDCNGNNEVTVNELVTMVNIALGTTPVSTCSAGDANANRQITIDEIVAGVNHALSGCR